MPPRFSIGLHRHHLLKLKGNIRFLAEISIILSIFTLIGSFGVIISQGVKLGRVEGREKDFALGTLTYVIVTFIVSSLDLGLSFLLLSAIKPFENVNLDQLLLFFRATLTILIIFLLQTLAFFVLLSHFAIFLGLLPSLFFKPVALIILNRYLITLMGARVKSLPVSASGGGQVTAWGDGAADSSGEEMELDNLLRKQKTF